MRVIKCDPPLDEFTSPAACLIPLIPNAIANIADERKEEFDNLFPDFSILISDSSEWIFKVATERKVIAVSVFCLEALWATAYAHILLYQNLVSGRMPDADFAVQKIQEPECKDACELLNWITRRRLGCVTAKDWPQGLPFPSQQFKKGDSTHIANEVALGAFGFIMHHELSHIRFLHEGESQISTERDADHAAVDWLLQDGFLNASSLEGRKRLLCIAHALSVTVIKGIYDGDFDGETHPRAFDRLEHALSRHLTDKNHLCRAFIAFVLHFHVTRTKMKFAVNVEEFKDLNDFDDIIQKFFEAFASFTESSL